MLVIKNPFSKPKLSREAFTAYFHRLPDVVQVNWIRDGRFIVGEVKGGDKEFMTQGRNAEEFVEMVNDAIFAVHDIPKEYIEVIKTVKVYSPNETELVKLNDGKITKSSPRFIKEKEEIRQLA